MHRSGIRVAAGLLHPVLLPAQASPPARNSREHRPLPRSHQRDCMDSAANPLCHIPGNSNRLRAQDRLSCRMPTDRHPELAGLAAGLDQVLGAPRDEGVLRHIVCRPGTGQRQVLAEARLDLTEGLVGDNWRSRGSNSTPDRLANPDMQLNVMNSRMAALLSQEPSIQALAGDQLYIDLDLSMENLPPGSRLALGMAVIEVTAVPHTGCAKFLARFGAAALKFVNSERGRQLRLRGLNAKVVQAGIIRVGDKVNVLR
jgi:hypothetical protein